MEKVIVGMTKSYKTKDYRLDWNWGDSYKNDDDCSQIEIRRNGSFKYKYKLFTLNIGHGFLTIAETNDILKDFGFELIELQED